MDHRTQCGLSQRHLRVPSQGWEGPEVIWPIIARRGSGPERGGDLSGAIQQMGEDEDSSVDPDWCLATSSHNVVVLVNERKEARNPQSHLCLHNFPPNGIQFRCICSPWLGRGTEGRLLAMRGEGVPSWHLLWLPEFLLNSLSALNYSVLCPPPAGPRFLSPTFIE